MNCEISIDNENAQINECRAKKMEQICDNYSERKQIIYIKFDGTVKLQAKQKTTGHVQIPLDIL